jgi:hypothetical protein
MKELDVEFKKEHYSTKPMYEWGFIGDETLAPCKVRHN